MTEKIFRAILAAAGGVLLAGILIILGCLYDYWGSIQEQQLWEELSYAATGVETSGIEYLQALDADSDRLTWIAADGAVLYDVQADAAEMENHADREEVREARENGIGTSSRYSITLLEKTLYCAKLLSDGSVLRISVSRATMAIPILGMLQPICIVLFAALIASFYIADRLSKRIVEPLNSIDLDHPLENQTYDEIAPLLRRINQQSRQIHTQLTELRQKKDEFIQITSNMNEGLVLLNEQSVILSINPAAKRLFHVEDTAVGQEFLTVERSYDLQEAMHRAMQEGHSEISLERGGRTYQMDMSRIESAGDAIGVVLLIFDVTEKMDAERSRREFTANVSHELKTPLTTILGSSEMLEGGIVKAEDIPRFASHIHKEAARLLTLIEDIIRLSQLDEGVPLPTEEVDLAAIAESVELQLREKASQQGVALHIQTEPCLLQGVPRLFHEILYNLTENAIKYNMEGGSVDILVAADGLLTVADTGIGISPEHQKRVFERFYRVDKSHSKQIGGTGLGLSIVKHACAYLGATIRLDSTLGKGTTIQVQFADMPKEE